MSSNNSCYKCQADIPEDEEVFIDPKTRKATMTGYSYCVGCAPEEANYEAN